MRKCILILAPHPDDECLMGLLPLRLQTECGFQAWVVPATLGSRVERQAARKQELAAACRVLGFRLRFLTTRDPVRELRDRLDDLQPAAVFLPHAQDGHPTHRATYRLGIAAMDVSRMPVHHVVETEYWHPLTHPNLMVAARKSQLAALRRALACHAGEIARNDYAARLPAWMSDNVRRGTELLGGMGTAAPGMAHATLYRARRRTAGRWVPEFRGGRILDSSADLAGLAALWSAPR